jgi:hypothetical protein
MLSNIDYEDFTNWISLSFRVVCLLCSSSLLSDSSSWEQSELYSPSSEFCAQKEGSIVCISPHTRTSNAVSSNSLNFSSWKTSLARRGSTVPSLSAKAGNNELQSLAPISNSRALVSSVMVDWSGPRICFWAYYVKLIILRSVSGHYWIGPVQ